jgi:UDP:flavonoid glycosyltransferase YjiC (YdhE family)
LSSCLTRIAIGASALEGLGSVRVLFTFAGGRGHLEPLVPIARAAADAGHTVAFVGRPWMVPPVEALGFPAFAAGSNVGLTPRRLPLAPVDLEKDMRDVGDGFGRRIARERAAGLVPLCGEWRPDLLVCEELDFGAMLIAERLGIPAATVLISATGSFVRPEFVAGPLSEVRAEFGLAPDSGLVMPSRLLVVSPFPPSLRDPAFPLPVTAHALRLVAGGLASDHPPRVYVTLGTVYNVESGDLFPRLLAGLRDLLMEVLITVGPDLDPAEFGPQPAHIRIERYLPQAEVLPDCDLVVSHGGSGSVLGALTHGLPMVLLPMGADQPPNAARCEALGVARVLDPLAARPWELHEAVLGVLADRTYRDSAESLRDEIDALPGPAHAVSLLESLAAGTGRGRAG